MSLAYRISGFNRRRKWKIFYKEINPQKEDSILDAGFSDREYSPTDNFLQKNYPYPEKITALGVDAPDEFIKRYPKIMAVQYDGGPFPFNDKEFNICWSNAVIEHVGSRQKQLEFLKEIKRVAQKAFITTPNRNFPIEIHTRTPLLHFLPKKIFEKYLKFIGKEWAAGDYMNLLSARDIKLLLAGAEVKNYKIIKNKLLFFTLDFIIVIYE